MITRHCSDEELQILAGEQQVPEPGMMQHMETCSFCREQLAAYRLVLSEIKKQPAAAFDFDLAGTVLQQLPVAATKTPRHWYTFVPFLLIATLVMASLYAFRNNFLHLSRGSSAVFLAIIGIACAIIIVFKMTVLYRRYLFQIKRLDFSE